MKKIYFGLLGTICIALFLVIHLWCQQNTAYDKTALMIANSILAVLSMVSYFMLQQKIKAERAQAFVNGVYGATLLRLMVCMGGILAYIMLNQGHLHKASIFSMMGMYMLYTIFETIIFARLAKQKS